MPVSPQPQPASRPPQRHETRCWRLSERSPWLYFWRLRRKHEPQLLLHLSLPFVPCGPPLPPECQTLRQRRQPRQLQPLRRSGARLEQQQGRPATVRSQPTQHVVLQPSRASRPLPPGPRSPRRELPLGWPSSAPQQPCVRLAPRARPHTRVCQARGPSGGAPGGPSRAPGGPQCRLGAAQTWHCAAVVTCRPCEGTFVMGRDVTAQGGLRRSTPRAGGRSRSVISKARQHTPALQACASFQALTLG